MAARESRRAFLKSVPPALAACGLSVDGRIGAGEPLRTTTGSGRDLDSLIGLILDTPRDRRVAVVGEELRRGLSYRELLTGLYLAARLVNVAASQQPRRRRLAGHLGQAVHQIVGRALGAGRGR